ncbi:hypothetical protein [Jannaschia formosa]|nr:hypothetical protein [Jannaschia formosa]
MIQMLLRRLMWKKASRLAGRKNAKNLRKARMAMRILRMIGR